jgi:uncharacterized membrane protein (UPF0127 family)
MHKRRKIPHIALLVCAVAVCLPASSQAKPRAVYTVPECVNPMLPYQIYRPSALEPPPSPTPVLALRTIGAPRAVLLVAVADDSNARELGLMCVLHLEPQHGMIFVFDKDAKQEFWMKNTLIPLDMVWVRSSGIVDTVAANVPRSTRATPDDAVARRAGFGKYVIELAAGEAAADGIVPGSELKVAPAL